MPAPDTVLEYLQRQGISRRGFLKFCAATASMMALPPTMSGAIAQALGNARRPTVIWLSFQECTGCTESLTRSHTPTLESLILGAISLDYHHTLQAASGDAAERARRDAMQAAWGSYLVVVDGSIPLKHGGVYSTIAGHSNRDILLETAEGAAAIISVGTCAAFGGIPAARPNPTGAVPVSELIDDKPIVNVPGCPPIPVVISGVLAHYLTYNRLPAMDDLGRPLAFYGDTIHDRCYRRPFYDRGLFAKSFDDEGARKGWCLYELGCKGPTTHNACATTKWNGGTSFPIESGHGCIGCSSPDFWDAGSFYAPIPASIADLSGAATGAVVAGAAAGAAAGWYGRNHKRRAAETRQRLTVDDLEDNK